MGRVLLFDIDGTLLTTGGVGRGAMARAFGALCGKPDALDGVCFGGMTDLGLARLGLEAAGLPPEEVRMREVLDLYVDFLAEALAGVPPGGVLGGVLEVLEAVSGRPGVAVGIATGNVRRGAGLKLAHAGLEGWFGFGGYGCDHELRPEVVRAGARRGAEALGVAPEGCQVRVIGDTPRDVSAAHAIGARCLAVSTGTATGEALAQAGADRVVASLSDPAVVGWLLES